EEHPRGREGDRREARRGSAGDDGGAARTAGRRAQDGERGARDVVPEGDGRGGRHARSPDLAQTSVDARGRSEENRAGPDGPVARGGVDRFLAPADLARPPDLRGAKAEVRRVRWPTIVRRRERLPDIGDGL